MIDTLLGLKEDFDEGEELTKFFEIMKRFNNYRPINIEVKKEIEQFFNYKWSNDKNLAISH